MSAFDPKRTLASPKSRNGFARRCRTRRQRKPERPRAPAATDRLAPMRSARRPTTRQRLRDARNGDGEVSRVMLHELEHPCPPTIISKSGLNVCFWHKAEITRLSPMSAQLAASFHFVSIQESGGASLTPVPTLVVQSADYG